MGTEDLKNRIKDIVAMAVLLRDKHIEHEDASVNYACIFSQNKSEYEELLAAARKIGEVIKETPTGQLFHIEPLKTVAGDLRLLKIRIPDVTRPERGDADFTISNFPEFEKKYLSKPNFKIIRRSDFYMIELMDSDFDVRAYFSNPPLDKQLNLENALN
jgi:hypothetical protein